MATTSSGNSSLPAGINFTVNGSQQGSGITISNNTIHDVSLFPTGSNGELGNGILTQGYTGVHIFGNTLYNVGTGIGVIAYYGTSDDTEIYNNNLYSSYDGISVSTSGDAGDNLTNVQIYNNKLHDFYKDLNASGSREVLNLADPGTINGGINGFNIYNNNLYGHLGAATGLLYVSTNCVPTSGCDSQNIINGNIYNNIIASSDEAGMQVKLESTVLNSAAIHNINMFNNTFAKIPGDTKSAGLFFEGVDNLTMNNNIEWGFEGEGDIFLFNSSCWLNWNSDFNFLQGFNPSGQDIDGRDSTFSGPSVYPFTLSKTTWRSLTPNIWNPNNVILTASLNSGGSGYMVGDILSVIQNGASNGQVTVTSTSSGVVSGIMVNGGGNGSGYGYTVANGVTTLDPGNKNASGATINITSVGSGTNPYLYPSIHDPHSIVGQDPLFTAFPLFAMQVSNGVNFTSTGSTTVNMIANSNYAYNHSFTLNDYIEYNYDGVVRKVTSVVGNTITFTPELATTPVNGDDIIDWGPTNNTFTYNLQLQNASSAIGVGLNLSSSGIGTTDIIGNARPAAGAWDIGAYQSSNQTQPAPPPVSPPGTLLGDVNGDGKVNIYDAELTAQYAIGNTVAGFNTAAAEVDGTGKVNVYDAFLIGEYAVGSISKYPAQN